jgi:hypothetical protein
MLSGRAKVLLLHQTKLRARSKRSRGRILEEANAVEGDSVEASEGKLIR